MLLQLLKLGIPPCDVWCASVGFYPDYGVPGRFRRRMFGGRWVMANVLGFGKMFASMVRVLVTLLLCGVWRLVYFREVIDHIKREWRMDYV